MDLSLNFPDVSYETLKKIFILIVIILILYKFKQNIEKRQKKEKFTSIGQSKILSEIFPVTNYYHLDNSRYEGIVYKDYLNLPILKCPTDYKLNSISLDPTSKIKPKTYHDQIVKYIRQKIYPIDLIQTNNNNIIDNLQNGSLDTAILNEEVLRQYIARDDDGDHNREINFSVIGGLYYLDLYLIAQPGDSMDRLSDLQSKIIINTVNINNEPIFLSKLVNSYQFNIENAVEIVVHDSIEKMINLFMKDDINYMFLMCHPIDEYILGITVSKKIKLIHLKDNYENVDSVSKGREEIDVSERPNSGQLIRKLKVLPEDNIKLVGNKIIQKENHLSILKRYIPRVYEKVIDLNYFHETDNLYSYLETYSIKYLLVARNDIDEKHIKILTGNLIGNMSDMRDNIINDNYIEGYFNHNNYDLKVEEMLVFDNNIPLHEKCKEIYEKVGLIEKKESISCNI